MVHQDFEKYAQEKQMNGLISDTYREFFKRWIDYKNRQLRILDFGCGDGKYYPFFKQYFNENNIYGVEISKIRVMRARQKGWHNVFLIDDLQPLPFSDEYFDLINFDQVVEHIPKNEIDFYLEEFKRVLKKEGKLIVITPNYPIKRCYDFLNAFLGKDFKRIFDDPTHITHYSFRNLNAKLKRYLEYVELYPTGGIFYKYFKNNFLSHKIIGICIKK